jgi:hypothetical protein
LGHGPAGPTAGGACRPGPVVARGPGRVHPASWVSIFRGRTPSRPPGSRPDQSRPGSPAMIWVISPRLAPGLGWRGRGWGGSFFRARRRAAAGPVAGAQQVPAGAGVAQRQAGGLDLPALVAEPDPLAGRVAQPAGQRGDEAVVVLDPGPVSTGDVQVRLDDPRLETVDLAGRTGRARRPRRRARGWRCRGPASAPRPR